MSAEVTVFRKEASFDLGCLADLAADSLLAAGAIRAVAFGSYARGTADGYSDLDVAVVLKTDRPFWERGALLPGLHAALPVAIDVLVYTPAEFARGLEKGFGVFQAIAQEGVTIFERQAG